MIYSKWIILKRLLFIITSFQIRLMMKIDNDISINNDTFDGKFVSFSLFGDLVLCLFNAGLYVPLHVWIFANTLI